MTDVREATDDLLAEKSDFEPHLRDLLEVDERTDGWTFDDVPFDSGTFGELVSRDIVVERDGKYEVADPEAVRASLDGDPADGDSPSRSLPSLSLPSVSRANAAALAAALAFVAAVRTYFLTHVFRSDGVLLSSNDPYYYRYWVEQLSAEAVGVFDFSVLSGLPSPVANGEPLTVGTLWWVTNLLGGADASGAVLAWYPVVSALVVAVLTYAIAKRLTDDPRVAVASVLFLAVLPAFAYRTGLGFADHHAFDYPWLALTALALVWLADVGHPELRDPRTWVVSGVLGFAVAGQVLAWEAGPLLIGALGVYVAVRTAADVRAERSSLAGNAPIVAGLAFASLLSHLAHTGFGWHEGVVAYSPALLLVGVVGVSLVGEAIHRARMPAFVLGTTEVAGALGGLALLQVFLPSYASTLFTRLDVLLFRTGPAETNSMFAGGALGPLLGPLFELGFAWLLAVPMLLYAGWRAYRTNRATWLVVVTYGWYFLALATLQRRFVGELSPFVAILVGWAFVAFAAKIDVAVPPAFDRDESTAPGRTDSPDRRSLRMPSRNTVTVLGVLFLLVTSAGAVQTAVRHEQVKIVGETYESAQWMDGYADQQEWEYPEDYVLSKWGRNRMYNYHVNGESRSYVFADQNYERFLAANDSEAEYQRLRDRVGFVVTRDLTLPGQARDDIMYTRLHQRFGSEADDGSSGVGHFRAVYASDTGATKVFTLVPGANVTGTASAGESVTVERRVEIEGAEFDYRRTVEAGDDGNFSVTVAHPGTYSVGNETVDVSEDAVRNGGNVTVGA
ncbi:STT3 domain-containing protein [Halorussus amylolyticus]|uniref:STT3 domain-containing protein n=1 Tax=Halorussus amylolyticus TaxID=1126242 RepID=UPI001045789C|nr:STT3 domain-containing protein [Halorussus amylolyticus]